ncbi:heme ABC transporter ATP-binding protein [Arenicella xantha]|uniref:Iron complex transport system ATP-binding protein n=1 Tax=Arenicella xantha TaxID=644221 RepID=A0A395JJ02_9GAMM|nr:heme ABC transporter ATP-binding protein [Arenicella xantha]RBP48917.1 iron complex transport system ATP-binding protein [Arenicella xantha]
MSIRVENLLVRLRNKVVLDTLNFSCQPGEINAIVGENGAGKSTLMNCLSGSLKYSGNVYINAHSLRDMSVKQQAKCRAVLPQNSTLNFPLDVREIVRLALSLTSISDDDQERIIRECLDLVDALPFIDRDYLSLSGGEKQRVQIARVICQLSAYSTQGSRFLLLDEPTSALDLKHQYSTLKMLRKLCGIGLGRNIGVLVILHDLNLASLYCDKVLLLKAGKLIKHDVPNAVFEERRIARTFGVEVSIGAHPDTQQPFMVPRL